jgi:phage I-like protein
MVGLTGKDPSQRTTWIHVAPFGVWEGHQDGAFELDREAFGSCISDTEARATPQSLDYEHASLHPTGEPTPAAGYVQKLEMRTDGLWALVEFTERAAGLIRAGEYRFCSGVFAFDQRDRKTGDTIACVLDSIALTNRPFIDGQKPIALTATRALTTVGPKMQITREDLESAMDKLGAESFTPDQLIALIEALQKMGEATQAQAEPAKEEEKPAEEAAASVALAEQAPAVEPAAPAAEPGAAEAEEAEGDALSRLMTATGLDEAGLMAAIDANFDAVVALLKGEAPEMAPAAMALSRDTVVKALTDSLGQARKRLAQYEAVERKREESKIDGEVEALVAQGKIHPSKKAEIRALAVKTPSAFRALTAALVPVYPTGKHASAITPSTPESQILGETVIDQKDPRVVALNASLEAIGIKDPKIRETKIREAISKKVAG